MPLPLANSQPETATGATKTPSSASTTDGEGSSPVPTSFLRLDQVQWGFGQSGKSHAPEPQSTQIRVLGEVSIPHPSNCGDQPSQDEPDQPDETGEEVKAAEPADTEKQEHETNQSLIHAYPLTDAPVISVTDPPEYPILKSQIAAL